MNSIKKVLLIFISASTCTNTAFATTTQDIEITIKKITAKNIPDGAFGSKPLIKLMCKDTSSKYIYGSIMKQGVWSSTNQSVTWTNVKVNFGKIKVKDFPIEITCGLAAENGQVLAPPTPMSTSKKAPDFAFVKKCIPSEDKKTGNCVVTFTVK